MKRQTLKLVALMAAALSLAWGVHAQDAPKVSLDKSPQIVKYQLKRLTNDELVKLERKDTEPKYKLVYEAIMVRKGLARETRIEAVGALAKINNSSKVSELLAGIGLVEPDDKGTLRELVSLLMAESPQDLAAQKEKIKAVAAQTDLPATVKSAAYGALITSGENPDAVWSHATENKNLPVLLGGFSLTSSPQPRGPFYGKVFPLVVKADDEPTRIAAVEAVSHIPGHEPEVFSALSEIIRSVGGELQAAAVRSIRRVPAGKWPKEQVEPLAQAVVKSVEKTPADQRTGPAAIEAIQLGNELAAALPAEKGAPIRKALRELGVRVVLIRTIRERMIYDLRYFAVEAGKPVQIVLENPDGMQHNLVVIAPGSLLEIGTAAAGMQPPADPNAKAYIPDSPKVLHATGLLNPDQTAVLNFVAPAEPGEYVYVCTFPGHFTLMHGVMVVTKDIEAWESGPKTVKSPLTGQPYDGPKNEPSAAAAEHHH